VRADAAVSYAMPRDTRIVAAHAVREDALPDPGAWPMRCIRSLLRWFAASLLPVAMAQAATVYECRGADGAIAWQDRSCAASQRQAEVEIAPPPPYAPSPDYRPVPASRVDARSECRER